MNRGIRTANKISTDIMIQKQAMKWNDAWFLHPGGKFRTQETINDLH